MRYAKIRIRKSMKHKAIALISGGLDSILAARVIMDQGIEVIGVCFVMSFASRDLEAFKKRVSESAGEAGIAVRAVDIADTFFKILKKPDHGYGANFNPCIDCKIHMLRLAGKIMEEDNADFVITGEVLGERPMSQRKEALNIITRESGLEGYLLRPLSAKNLEPTVPEENGIVDRDRLLDIQGRSRAPQLKLAGKYGIKKYFTPAGGCLLTDPGFSRRLIDLREAGLMELEEIKLLKFGRHFRLDSKSKAVVGRDQCDNEGLLAARKDSDICFHIKELAGPYVILRGEASDDNIKKAASLCLSHSKHKSRNHIVIEYWRDESEKKEITGAVPMDRSLIEEMRI